jgi:hypothetical protein
VGTAVRTGLSVRAEPVATATATVVTHDYRRLRRHPARRFVFLLWRYARLPLWQAAICAAFGYYLASSSIGPDIGRGLRALARFLAGLDI